MQPKQRLHLGRAARVRLGEHRQRLRRGGVEAARRVAEGAAEREPHRAAQQPGAELPDPVRLVAVRRVAGAADEARADRDVASRPTGRARAGGGARRRDAGRRRRRGRSRRSRARAPTRSRPRSPACRPRFSPNESTSAPSSRASAAVPSVEPSSTTSTSASGSSPCSSASTARRFPSSFQAGMKTSVSCGAVIRMSVAARPDAAAAVQTSPS